VSGNAPEGGHPVTADRSSGGRFAVGGGPSRGEHPGGHAAGQAGAAAYPAPDAAGGRLPYPVLVGPGLLDAVGTLVARIAPAHRYALVSDATVGALYAERVLATLPAGRTLRLEVPAGEAFKTRESWARLTDELLAAGAGRDTTIVALGGGVVGDLAGFVAATYMRGVPVVQLPTTLLAMIDAAVGGKTAVDTPAGKNLVGAFHPPAAVLADLETLATLPRREIAAGLAEALKHGVIADAGYFQAVVDALPGLLAGGRGVADAMATVVVRSVAIKADVVSRDEREGGMRKILNFGHTIGHAVETLSDYALLHGEAVAIGMAVESELAERVGLAEAGTAARVAAGLRAAGLPVRVPEGMSAERIVAATHGDKKARDGAAEYALPRRVGAMAAADRGWSVRLTDDQVRGVLA
jgi:3-dehydroquinate synthase